MKALGDEGIVFDPARSNDLGRLRADSERIAAGMDHRGGDCLPMLWSGIPRPERTGAATCGHQLVLSIGGTKTEFAVLRLQEGQLFALDLETGKEVCGQDEILRVKDASRMRTPTHSPEVPTGHDMFRVIVKRMADRLRPHVDGALQSCESILFSWGYAHRIVRTAEKLAGGFAGIATKLTKGQGAFSKDLSGRDLAKLLLDELESQLGWSRPVAIANDTVMALHYFLGPQWDRFHDAGLFINGTGTNFALAEPYAVRPGGFISDLSESYQPERLTTSRQAGPSEKTMQFFVNYETGSIELVGTRTRFDTEEEYPIERNALAGGNAYPQQFREFVRALLTEELGERLRSSWWAAGGDRNAEPGAPEIGRLSAASGTNAVAWIFGGVRVEEAEAVELRTLARAIVLRSALHVALVLNAVTLRRGFGLGGDSSPDLLGMEGSVWKITNYPELVRAWWQVLQEKPLHVELHAEPSFNASLAGPLYLIAAR